MGRKISPYMRKRKAQGKIQNGEVMFKPNAWLDKLKHSTGYTDESFAGEEPTTKIADRVMIEARMALKLVTEGTAGAGDTDCHDMLAHCIGIAQIRILDIGGPLANSVMQELNEAAKALHRTRERWQRTGKWGFDGPAMQSIHHAIDTYEIILRSSSPLQMEHAQHIRLDQLKNDQKEAA